MHLNPYRNLDSLNIYIFYFPCPDLHYYFCLWISGLEESIKMMTMTMTMTMTERVFLVVPVPVPVHLVDLNLDSNLDLDLNLNWNDLFHILSFCHFLLDSWHVVCRKERYSLGKRRKMKFLFFEINVRVPACHLHCSL